MSASVPPGIEIGEGIFAKRGEIAYTWEIIRDLTDDENRPWREYDRAGEITPKKLADLLSDFRIKSARMRRGKEENLWGYRASWFSDLFAAYFPDPEQMEQMEQMEQNEEELNEALIQSSRD